MMRETKKISSRKQLLKFLRKEFAAAGLFSPLYKACDTDCYVMPSPVESLASMIVALIIWQALVVSL